MKSRLLLIRHGEASGNMDRTFHGWTDSELTKRGHIQAKLLAKRLNNTEIDVDVLYSSSLKRAINTAEYIAKEKNISIILTDELKEINGGDWERQKWSDLPIKWPLEYETWNNKPDIHKMPNGESMEKFQQRLIKETLNILKDNIEKNICIVTHGTAIKCLMCHFFKYKLKDMCNIPWYDNTSMTIVNYNDDSFNVILEGDISHLDRETSTFMNQEWWHRYIQKLKKPI